MAMWYESPYSVIFSYIHVKRRVTPIESWSLGINVCFFLDSTRMWNPVWLFLRINNTINTHSAIFIELTTEQETNRTYLRYCMLDLECNN